MNILILHTNSDLYGGSKIISIVIKILAEGNHKPMVVLSEDGPLVEELRALNVDLHFIKLGILRRKYLNIRGIINRFKVTKNAWHALNKLIDQHQIEVIYSNTTVVFIGAFLARRRKIKHVWHVHEIIQKPKFAAKAVGYLLKNYADQIIVVSDAVKNHWQKHVRNKQINRIYNGIDITPFETSKTDLRTELNLKDNDLLVTMIGRVNHWKGQGYFLDIANKILSQTTNTYFLLVGDAYPGNEHLVDDLVNKIASMNSDRVTYLGYRTDTPNILASSDIFVLPSTQPDPFPTVILEAMASSKPVVATAHGGALEMVIDGVTGYHIPYDNADRASQTLLKLIDAESERLAFGKAAYQRIKESYSLESFRNTILATIDYLN